MKEPFKPRMYVTANVACVTVCISNTVQRFFLTYPNYYGEDQAQRWSEHIQRLDSLVDKREDCSTTWSYMSMSWWWVMQPYPPYQVSHHALAIKKNLSNCSPSHLHVHEGSLFQAKLSHVTEHALNNGRLYCL